MNVIPTASRPIKLWTGDMLVEEAALNQLHNLANHPAVSPHVAVMPDVHMGVGSTVGSVIPTRNAIIPAAVGVDIGCGIMAVKLALTASQLPDNLFEMRSAIEKAIPHGRTDNGGANDRGAWGQQAPGAVNDVWNMAKHGYKDIITKYPKLDRGSTWGQLGTLGTGNHFVEVCLDEKDGVWIMLHSGSRGVGNRIGSFFIEKAKEEMARWFISLPDKDLAYLPEGSQYFDDYVNAVEWAQSYAYSNRQLMMTAAIAAVGRTLGTPLAYATAEAVNCHHNYIAREHHFGSNYWITRKGAVRARTGDLGIIPGSMGTKSYIVRGKGEVQSFTSCSHGAGRTMSRTQARKTFTLEDHAKATVGVECRKDAEVIDETPQAYKPIEDVMAAQSDLVEIVATLKQVLCVKG